MERERDRGIVHLLVHSPNARDGAVLGQSKEAGTQSKFSTWVSGTKLLQSSCAAFQGIHEQKVEIGSKTGTGPQVL